MTKTAPNGWPDSPIDLDRCRAATVHLFGESHVLSTHLASQSSTGRLRILSGCLMRELEQATTDRLTEILFQYSESPE